MRPLRLTITINLPNLRIQGLLVVDVERTRLSSLHPFADFLCALKRPTRCIVSIISSNVQLIAHTNCDLNALVTKEGQGGLYYEACSKEECFPRLSLARTHSKD